MFIQNDQDTERPSICRPRQREIIAPDMILLLRVEPDARSVVEPLICSPDPGPDRMLDFYGREMQPVRQYREIWPQNKPDLIQVAVGLEQQKKSEKPVAEEFTLFPRENSNFRG